MARKQQPKEWSEDMEHPAPADMYADFDSFWLELKNKNRLKDSVKVSLKKYFQGLDILSNPSEYSKAAKDFGLRI